MPKNIAILIVAILLVQYAFTLARTSSLKHYLLTFAPIVLLVGCLCYRYYFQDPLKRCPLCKKWLKDKDYEFISHDGTEAVVLCKKYNKQYKIRKR